MLNSDSCHMLRRESLARVAAGVQKQRQRRKRKEKEQNKKKKKKKEGQENATPLPFLVAQ